MKLKSEFIRLTNSNRLYDLNIPVIGLTGGIATGKSTVSNILTSNGLSVIDADKLVKSIYSKEESVAFIKKNYPDVITEGKINFAELRKKVFNSSAVKYKIEEFIYSRLPGAFSKAVTEIKGSEVIVYDVPLLFEKKLEPSFDLIVLVYAPKNVQIERLMARDHQSKEMAESIIAQQMDIEEKKALANVILENTGSMVTLNTKISQFISQYFT